MLYSKDMQLNDNIPEKLLKPYDPSSTEDRIYKLWEDSGLFNPDTCVEKGVTNNNSDTFSMVMPPPNVTGVLHMGHALMISWQDIATRYNRMQGRRTLWLPGTDHAAIATQSKVEKDIQKKESLSRHDLGREELLKRIEKFISKTLPRGVIPNFPYLVPPQLMSKPKPLAESFSRFKRKIASSRGSRFRR
jgi:valyl-tRNA synthetase